MGIEKYNQEEFNDWCEAHTEWMRKNIQIPHIKINGDEMHISELIRMYSEVCKERMR